MAGGFALITWLGRPTAAVWSTHAVVSVTLAVRIGYGLVVTAVGAAPATAFGRGERADVRIRFACFVLFVVGFQFDLVAS
ncbi:hypothetical protein [Saccharothrix variisporea]|uniref:Uncharacterized protein n=1 Tax=Saccharothrix variisporea TaxID=543527 RepID=A0A495XGV2_9PSEU|nr:hypothetical protein [Saccharothrix variisporea]RKT70798.1 hypothetical protein DFJ66_4070 [Saccharothrix variisporea]